MPTPKDIEVNNKDYFSKKSLICPQCTSSHYCQLWSLHSRIYFDFIQSPVKDIPLSTTTKVTTGKGQEMVIKSIFPPKMPV